MNNGAPTAVRGQALLQPAQVAPDHRLHEGVHGAGAEPFVLPLLAGQLMRQAHRRSRQAPGERPAHLQLVCRVGVAVQEPHGNGLDPFPAQRVDQAVELPAVERGLHAAVEAHALAQLEAQRARHQRPGAPAAQVVEPRTVLALDLQHVAEAGGRDQRHPRPGALQHGVGSHRGAVDQQLDVLCADADPVDDFADAENDAARRIVRRGDHLVKRQAPAFRSERHQIGEGPPGIDADPDHATAPAHRDTRNAPFASSRTPCFLASFTSPNISDSWLPGCTPGCLAQAAHGRYPSGCNRQSAMIASTQWGTTATPIGRSPRVTPRRVPRRCESRER